MTDGATGPPPVPDLALPGPIDREDFARAQRRHRRASRWYTAASALAMLVMGIPLAVVVTPLVLLLFVLGADVVNLVVAVPDVPDALRSLDPAESGGGNALRIVAIVAVLLVPGAVLHLAAWAAVRRLFVRAGSGAALAVGARDPRPGALEEHQLVNVAQEVSIACAVTPPRVQLIDSEIPNAAVIGCRADDATLVVTIGLLATLDRSETQAIVAEAIGGAGNGDLAIGAAISIATQTTGMMAMLLAVPTSAGSRHEMRRLVRLLLRRDRGRGRAARELAEAISSTTPEDDEGRGSRALRILLFPVALAGGVYSLMLKFYSSLFVDPLLRRGWRARKRLADATAVELTRNPDAVARALSTLAGRADLLPGTAWASHLFVVGPEAVMAKNTALLQQKLASLPRGRARLDVFADPDAVSAFAQLATIADAASYHPPMGERLLALHRLGASAEATAGVPMYPRRSRTLTRILFAPFRLVGFLFQLAVPLFALAVALFLGCISVLPVAALLHALLR